MCFDRTRVTYRRDVEGVCDFKPAIVLALECNRVRLKTGILVHETIIYAKNTQAVIKRQ